MNEFKKEVVERIAANACDQSLQQAAQQFLLASTRPKYSYNFAWLGRPIIQYPQDMVAMQELIWEVKPDLIIETGIAHGGSLILSASMLAMLDMEEAIQAGKSINPAESARKVIGIDIDIRQHNLIEIEKHVMASRIHMIQGSSIAAEIVEEVRRLATGYKKVMVCLDSNHTHEHVLAELEAYAPLTSLGSYCVVFDTVIEDLPASMYPDRSWGPGDNPKTAVWTYLKTHPEFVIDKGIDHKLLISVAPDGFLKRIA